MTWFEVVGGSVTGVGARGVLSFGFDSGVKGVGGGAVVGGVVEVRVVVIVGEWWFLSRHPWKRFLRSRRSCVMSRSR